MSDKKITDLPSAGSIALTALVETVDVSGPTSKSAALSVVRTAMMPVDVATEATGVLPSGNVATTLTGKTLTTATIVAASNTITDTAAAVGDILRHDGTHFVRLPRGSAGTVLSVNGFGTNIAWAAPTADIADVTGLGTNVEAWLATPSGANLAAALTSALPVSKGGTNRTALGSALQVLRTNAGATDTEWGTPPVIFDDSTPANLSNIRSDVANPAAIDNTKVGITSFGHDTAFVSSLGVTGNYATCTGGDMPSCVGDYSTGGGYRANARGMASTAFGYSAFADGEGCTSMGRSNVSGAIQGALTGNPSLSFASAGRTLTRAAGDWTVDQFVAGSEVTITGSASNNFTAIVTSVTTTVLTFISGTTVVNESPVVGVTVVAAEKMYATTFGRQVQARGTGSFGAGFENTSDINASYSTMFGIGCSVGPAGSYGVAMGDQCVVNGLGGVALGVLCTAGAGSLAGGSDADGCVALGYIATATGSTAVAIGNHAVADHVGGLALGATASSTAAYANAIGQAASAENDYSTAFTKCRVTAVSAFACGAGSVGTRYGEFVHSSNQTNGVEGLHALDMQITGTAAPAFLLDMGGQEITLENQKVYSMRVRVVASKVGGSVVAHEVHELLLKATGGTLSIISDDIITSGTANFAAVGWTVAISVIGGGSPLTMRITCDPAADTVNVAARVEWSAMPGFP